MTDLIAQLEALIDEVSITEPWQAREGWPALQDGFVVCAFFAEEPHLPELRDAAAFVVTKEHFPDEQLPHLAELLARCSPANLRTLLDALRTATARAEALERERDEARAAAGLGCDANGGGEHSIMKQGNYAFCHKCGSTIKAPTIHERARQAESRAEAAERDERLREALEAVSPAPGEPVGDECIGRTSFSPRHNDVLSSPPTSPGEPTQAMEAGQ